MRLDVGPEGQVITVHDIDGLWEGSVINDVEDHGDSWYGIVTDRCCSYYASIPKSACVPFDPRVNQHNMNLMFGFGTEMDAKKLSENLVRDRVLTRFRLGIKTKPPRGAGNYTPGVKVMIVGERTSHPDENKYHAPFCSTKACSGWLNALLEAEAIPEESLFWINALDNDGTPMDLDRLYAYLQPGVVFALGKVAEKRLTQCGVPYVAFSHPQYHKRFKHKEPYPLIQALKDSTRV